MTTEERFWAKVQKAGPGECWIWKAGFFSCRASRRAPEGLRRYGQFYDPAKGRPVYAHRYAYGLLVRPLSDEEKLMHRCDTPACVNPGHLKPGDQDENMRDAMRRGRCAKKLNEAQIKEIRRMRGDGFTLSEIASRFSVHKSTVGRILRGEIWGWV